MTTPRKPARKPAPKRATKPKAAHPRKKAKPMTDVPTQLPIKIRHRDEDRVVYRSTTAADLRAAVAEAVASGADLSECDLSGADLRFADLRFADLRGADLSGVNLHFANLSGADLSDAYLSECDKVLSTASVQFTGHGQGGRALVAVKGEKSLRLWCGCFTGTPDELRAFIKGDRKEYAKTRTLALDTVLALLEAQNEAAP